MKNIKILLSLLLVLCMAFCLCACGGENENTETEPKDSESVEDVTSDSESESDTVENVPAFNVTVVDENGTPVKGVMVQICKDSCVPAMTNDEGIVTFNIEITDGYKLSVMSCPAGYEYTGDAEVYLDDGATEYTLTVSASEVE